MLLMWPDVLVTAMSGDSARRPSFSSFMSDGLRGVAYYDVASSRCLHSYSDLLWRWAMCHHIAGSDMRQELTTGNVDAPRFCADRCDPDGRTRPMVSESMIQRPQRLSLAGKTKLQAAALVLAVGSTSSSALSAASAAQAASPSSATDQTSSVAPPEMTPLTGDAARAAVDRAQTSISMRSQ